MSDQHDSPVEVADAAEGHVEPEELAPSEDVGEPKQAENDNPLAGMSMDDVVSAVLQGKFTTDASQQRQRLAAAGYDVEAVTEAVQRRLAQRYE